MTICFHSCSHTALWQADFWSPVPTVSSLGRASAFPRELSASDGHIHTRRYTHTWDAGLDSAWQTYTTTGISLVQMGTQVGIRQHRRESWKVGGDLPGLCPPCCSEYAFLYFSVDHIWAEVHAYSVVNVKLHCPLKDVCLVALLLVSRLIQAHRSLS